MSKKVNGDDHRKGPNLRKFNLNIFWLYALMVAILLWTKIFEPSAMELYGFREVKEKCLANGDVDKLVVVNGKFVEVYIKADRLNNPRYSKVAKKTFNQTNLGPHYKFNIGSIETFLNELEKGQSSLPPEFQPKVSYEERTDWIYSILKIVMLLVMIYGFLVFLSVRAGSFPGAGGGPGGIFNIGKSRAKLYERDTKIDITFNDVAGLDEAKVEVVEIVDFLKNPKKYTALGGKIPKGALLIGHPGTGKTLIAKAMAGEAKVPFFSMSGSDFVEMFVGVGASRVRDLFKQAREKAPCILFIDEIDAIGRARGRSTYSTNDERESTLNQLLVEMDGFGTETGIIVIAATNRPDVLDRALLRPGRFDRQISIDRPDLNGRKQILEVHLQHIKTSPQIDVESLAVLTPGFAGADLANICNEAALIAARNNSSEVRMQDFNDAIDRTIGGLEKKNKVISPVEKKVIAYHEAGHAICGWFLEGAKPLVKVSIVPRGVAALGFAQYLQQENYLYSTQELLDEICTGLGGRVAEELVFGKISTGAQNDLQMVTGIAYQMVAEFGMSPAIGHVSFPDRNDEDTFTKPYSEETAKLIDQEVRLLIEAEYGRTKELLTARLDDLKRVACALLEKEVLIREEIENLIGKRPSATHKNE